MAAHPLHTEDTPNPHALKFIAHHPFPPCSPPAESPENHPGSTPGNTPQIIPQNSPAAHPRTAAQAPSKIRSYRCPADADAAHDTLAQAIFAVGSVVSVMIVGDFVTVNKKPTARWPRLKPKIAAVLQDHLAD